MKFRSLRFGSLCRYRTVAVRLCRLRSLATTTLAALALLAALPRLAAAAEWVASIDDKSGLPQLARSGSIAVAPSFVFWGSQWAWTETQAALKVTTPYRYALAGRNPALGFDFAADIRKDGEQRLIWDFRLDATGARAEVMGGGMVFKFDLAHFAAELGEPTLLPDNRGWRWGRDGGRRIEMRFDPPLAGVYFERGEKSELRAFFYKGSIPAGQRRHTATLTLAGDIALGPTLDERFGLADPKTWPADRLDWKTSPVDLSFLNAADKPAGKRGFVKAAGDKLVFADGTPARFWGTNLSAYTLFATPKEMVKVQAKRLAALGFNLVRLHHHDSAWVNPNIFGDQKLARDTQRPSAESLDKIDWWIKCLKDEGIYIWLDMHVERKLRSGDAIYGYAEIARSQDSADLKGYSYVNLAIQQAMKRFAAAYVGHLNPHTGLALKDEPAIVAMLVTNENDITHHFGNALLPDKNVPDHSRLYMGEAEMFSRTHNLPRDKTWQAWQHGPAKLFLNDLERRFAVDMIRHLRESGVKVPIATTNSWGEMPLSSLPALTAGDVIDVHSYGGVGQLEKSPLSSASLVHWIAAAQVVGKPLTVTEWNAEPFPTPDRHALPLYVAGAAAHQGWDALMQYAYAQEPLGGWVTASNWHAYSDPALLATLPAAALLYRRGDVREATTAYVFDPGAAMFNQPISAANSPALRGAAELGKLVVAMPATKELPWLEKSAIPANAKILRDPAQSPLPAQAVEAVSDTGELRRNWAKGIHLIDTPRTQAAMGWIGSEAIALADIDVKLVTRNASVAVQALDDAPIAQSKDILISLAARAVPKEGNKTPFHIEPVVGELAIRAAKGMKLHKRGASGDLKEIPVAYKDGKYLVKLDESLRTNWLFLK